MVCTEFPRGLLIFEAPLLDRISLQPPPTFELSVSEPGTHLTHYPIHISTLIPTAFPVMSSPFSPSPGVSSSSPPALATPYFADAFEFLGARVHADLLAWSPHFNDDNTSPAPTSRRAIAARSAEIAKAREKAAHWVKLKVIRMLKSGFTASLGKGKRTADVSEPSSDDTRRSKRQRHATPPTYPHPSSAAASIAPMDATFSEDSLAPFHRPIPHSMRSAPYTRIRPKEMVKLSIDTEFILVFPAVSSTLHPKCFVAAKDINMRIDRVLIKSCSGLTPSERAAQLSLLKQKHMIARGSDTYYEFPARLKHFGELQNLQINSLRASDLDRLWKSDGFGPSIELCGYARTTTALLRLRYYPHIEMYQRSSSLFLDDVIFPNSGDLDEPLLNEIWAAKGCTVRTVEIMMRYYQQLSKRRQDQFRYLKNKNAKDDAITTSMKESRASDTKLDYMRNIKSELDKTRLFSFADKVDAMYESKYKNVYSTFVSMRNTIMSPADISMLYQTFRRDFPHTHALFSIIVSKSQDRIEVDKSMDIGKGKVIESESDDSCDENDDGTDLSRLQRSIYEYFLSFIRHKSQKRLKYWSMLTPLGYFSRGFRIPGSRSHLSGASCGLLTAWKNCNHLYETCMPSRKEMIQQLVTSSACGDNWQVKIGKDFQDGKSAIMQRGTAFLMKKNKCMTLPAGTVMSSPSGLRFTVSNTERINPYIIVIRGSLLPNQRDVDLTTNHGDVEKEEIRRSETGDIQNGFNWPRIGWEVILIKGFDPCRELTYVDQYVPAPFNARLDQDDAGFDSLFERRHFSTPADNGSMILTTSAYCNQLRRARDISNICSFIDDLEVTHAWEDEIKLVADEEKAINNSAKRGVDGREDDTINLSPMLQKVPKGSREEKKYTESNNGKYYASLPRSNEKEAALINTFQKCERELYWARTYQRDVQDHINPLGRQKDRFLFWPIYGRDETSVEGMMMVVNHLLEEFGLTEEIIVNGEKTGNYRLLENALNRLVFLYGDALTVSNWNHCFMRLAHQLTQLGQKKHVECLMKAYKRIVVQKGLFHQGMHQVCVIYSLYYGGFLQCLQVALARKRITGEPIKGRFQDHEIFLITTYLACVRYMMRMFMKATILENLLFIEGEDPSAYLKRIQHMYQKFQESWQNSAHEPSRMVALFIKVSASYLRCKKGVHNVDFWLLEQESCDWMGPWKMLGKSTYLRLQCMAIESLYGTEGLSPFTREVMRINRLIILSETETGVSFDFVNELYNLWLKTPPSTPYIETAVERSRHSIMQRTCSAEIFNVKSKKNKATGKSDYVDKLTIEFILTRAEIFHSHEKVEMHVDFFWKVIRKRNDSGTVLDRTKEFLPFSPAEQRIRDRINNIEMDENDMVDELDNDDDDNESTTSSVGIADERTQATAADIDDPSTESDESRWDLLSDDLKAKEAKESLKQLGNIARRKLHKHATKDVFVEGRMLLKKNIAKIRRKALRRAKRKYQLIMMSMSYFDTQMTYRRAILDSQMKKIERNQMSYVSRDWEEDYRDMMKIRRLNGDNDVSRRKRRT